MVRSPVLRINTLECGTKSKIRLGSMLPITGVTVESRPGVKVLLIPGVRLNRSLLLLQFLTHGKVLWETFRQIRGVLQMLELEVGTTQDLY